jgi:hypothetical protein
MHFVSTAASPGRSWTSATENRPDARRRGTWLPLSDFATFVRFRYSSLLLRDHKTHSACGFNLGSCSPPSAFPAYAGQDERLPGCYPSELPRARQPLAQLPLRTHTVPHDQTGPYRIRPCPRQGPPELVRGGEAAGTGGEVSRAASGINSPESRRGDLKVLRLSPSYDHVAVNQPSAPPRRPVNRSQPFSTFRAIRERRSTRNRPLGCNTPFSVPTTGSWSAPARSAETLLTTRPLDAKPREGTRGASLNRGPDPGSRERRVAPQVGLEPTTLRLTAECSTIELLRIGGREKEREASRGAASPRWAADRTGPARLASSREDPAGTDGRPG